MIRDEDTGGHRLPCTEVVTFLDGNPGSFLHLVDDTPTICIDVNPEKVRSRT